MKSSTIPVVVLIGAGLFLLGFLNPEHYAFPRCPFLSLTGFQCPGCGSQRAIHFLLHGRLFQAASMNLLFIPGVFYAGTGFVLSSMHPSSWPGIQQMWYGKKAAYIALVVILIFWIGRNIF